MRVDDVAGNALGGCENIYLISLLSSLSTQAT
jgi:hypothetical protein